MLRLDNISVARGGVPILDGVSFDVTAGEALVLRGPNGSGKTTLLRTIAGLQPPLTGEITVSDDLIAYAAHADGLKYTLTVAENLTFWAETYGARADIAQSLAAFELTDLHDRPAGQMSAGQKRRLGLARLLVTGRPLWVLDEPTVSLDAASVRLFATAVQNHLDTGGAALIATHIDLGLPNARIFDLSPFQAAADAKLGASDEAFL